jgi:steroid 5-alpha reductase family enzyme
MAAISIALFLAMLIQLILFIPAFGYKTDKLTDLSYALTFIILSILLLSINTVTTGKLLLLLMITLWAIRLGAYLVKRIHAMGRDARFDGIREDFFKFLGFWLLQGFTVWVIMIPAALYFSLPDTNITFLSIIGIIVWLKGLLIESIADWQKFSFKSDPKNAQKWIDSGLWAYSRHPNYFGEILCWVGIYIFTAASLSGFSVLLALISPVFITILLLYYSGVPSLEKSADARYGHDHRYRAYKKNTSLLFLWPPKHKKLTLQKKFRAQKATMRDVLRVIKRHAALLAKKLKQKRASCIKKMQQRKAKRVLARKKKEQSKLLMITHLSAKKTTQHPAKRKKIPTKTVKPVVKKKTKQVTKKKTKKQPTKKVIVKKVSRTKTSKKSATKKRSAKKTPTKKITKKKTTTRQQKKPNNKTKAPTKKTVAKKKKPQFSLVKTKPRAHKKKRR